MHSPLGVGGRQAKCPNPSFTTLPHLHDQTIHRRNPPQKPRRLHTNFERHRAGPVDHPTQRQVERRTTIGSHLPKRAAGSACPRFAGLGVAPAVWQIQPPLQILRSFGGQIQVALSPGRPGKRPVCAAHRPLGRQSKALGRPRKTSGGLDPPDRPVFGNPVGHLAVAPPAVGQTDLEREVVLHRPSRRTPSYCIEKYFFMYKITKETFTTPLFVHRHLHDVGQPAAGLTEQHLDLRDRLCGLRNNVADAN